MNHPTSVLTRLLTGTLVMGLTLSLASCGGEILSGSSSASDTASWGSSATAEPTFQREITVDGKAQLLELTWLCGGDCAVGYDAQRMMPDALSSVSPMALCGTDSRDITFIVSQSDNVLSDAIAQVKENMGENVTEETVTLGWDGLNATCLTSKANKSTLERRYLLESDGQVWIIAYHLPTRQQAALQPVLDAMANTFRVLPIVN